MVLGGRSGKCWIFNFPACLTGPFQEWSGVGQQENVKVLISQDAHRDQFGNGVVLGGRRDKCGAVIFLACFTGPVLGLQEEA